MQTLRSIGLAGLGFLGRGIAACLLDHGFQVIALEPEEAGWRAAPQSDRLIRAQRAEDFSGCELVIESITESFEAKDRLFGDLEEVVDATTPIASNTSGFPISLLQQGRKYPERFAGMHWTSPAYASRFLEIIRGEKTSDETIYRIETLARELEKEPAVVEKDVPGFVANRIAYAMYREAIHLVEEGVASIENIDLLCQHSMGMWMAFCGPFRWMDITGGPALYAKVMETILPTLHSETAMPETMRRMQLEDKRGTQSGGGFYHYEAGDAEEWQRRLHEHAVKVWKR